MRDNHAESFAQTDKADKWHSYSQLKFRYQERSLQDRECNDGPTSKKKKNELRLWGCWQEDKEYLPKRLTGSWEPRQRGEEWIMVRDDWARLAVMIHLDPTGLAWEAPAYVIPYLLVHLWRCSQGQRDYESFEPISKIQNCNTLLGNAFAHNNSKANTPPDLFLYLTFFIPNWLSSILLMKLDKEQVSPVF